MPVVSFLSLAFALVAAAPAPLVPLQLAAERRLEQVGTGNLRRCKIDIVWGASLAPDHVDRGACPLPPETSP